MSVEVKLLDELTRLLAHGLAASTIPQGDFPATRALIEGLTRQNSGPAEGVDIGSQYTHVRRGSKYTVLVGNGRLQTDKPLCDNTVLISYVDDDGQVWHRTPDEFLDGRFVRQVDF